MNIDDLSGMRQQAAQDRITVPDTVEVCPEPRNNPPPDGFGFDEYIPMPTPQPVWPRVFPGL